MKNVNIISHPLVRHKISLMRDINTGSKDFRELVSETAMLLCYEATKDLPLTTQKITTPICDMEAEFISGRKLAFVPILRAGLAMVDGVVRLVPAAKIGHIGMFRDEETKIANTYYYKMPFDIAQREVIIVDIMLATGSTAVKAIDLLKNDGCLNIKFMCILAAPEGIKAVTEAHPDVAIYCGMVDERLNENLYIVPGLGDAGDRVFGTK